MHTSFASLTESEKRQLEIETRAITNYSDRMAARDKMHPLGALARTVAHRLANPTNRARMAAPVAHARGSNGRKTIIKGNHNLPGFANPTDSKTQRLLDAMPAQDVEEIRGCIALTLAQLGNPERLDFAAWKAIFSSARHTLGLKRKIVRENLADSLDSIDFHSELQLDRALIVSLEEDRAESDTRQEAKRDTIAKAARRMLALLRAARRDDDSRKARANHSTARRYLRKAIRASLGNGHGHTLTRTAAYEQQRAFLAYLAAGETALAREQTAARELEQVAESARLMFAVAE